MLVAGCWLGVGGDVGVFYGSGGKAKGGEEGFEARPGRVGKIIEGSLGRIRP